MTANLLIRNTKYSGVRSVISASSSIDYTYFCEGEGSRYYVNRISGGDATLEAATFDGFLSFTMSGSQSTDIYLAPITTGETLVINSTLVIQNSALTKTWASDIGGIVFRHSGSALSQIGSAVAIWNRSNFTAGQIAVSAAAYLTQSVYMRVTNTSGDAVDCDLYFTTKKGYHTIINAPNSLTPISPPYPTS